MNLLQVLLALVFTGSVSSFGSNLRGQPQFTKCPLTSLDKDAMQVQMTIATNFIHFDDAHQGEGDSLQDTIDEHCSIESIKSYHRDYKHQLKQSMMQQMMKQQ